MNESPASSGGHTREPFSTVTVRHAASYHNSCELSPDKKISKVSVLLY